MSRSSAGGSARLVVWAWRVRSLRGWQLIPWGRSSALQDTTSFVKVLADPGTRLLLGAHIIGPQASILIQPLVQAMCLGNTLDQVASGVLYIHPALTEVIEQTLLEF